MLPSYADFGSGPVVAGGLHRTPLSGGVQSATAKHDLPRPAVAVRNLMEQARYAHLCTLMSRMHHRRAGYPFGSLVDFATEFTTGAPLLALSPLAIHTRNALADPRSNLVVQMPGWSGLANARVTVFGDLTQLTHPDDVAAAADAMALKHSPTTGSGAWDDGGARMMRLPSNFLYFRMSHVTDIYFVGGFGTVQWVDVAEYAAARPDAICTRDGVTGTSPERTLAALNASFKRDVAQSLLANADEALLVSIDRTGVDCRVRRGGDVSVERLRFGSAVETPQQAHDALQILLDAGAGGQQGAGAKAR